MRASERAIRLSVIGSSLYGRVLAEGRKPQQTPSQSFFAALKTWSISPPRFKDRELPDLTKPGFPRLFPAGPIMKAQPPLNAPSTVPVAGGGGEGATLN